MYLLGSSLDVGELEEEDDEEGLGLGDKVDYLSGKENNGEEEYEAKVFDAVYQIKRDGNVSVLKELIRGVSSDTHRLFVLICLLNQKASEKLVKDGDVLKVFEGWFMNTNDSRIQEAVLQLLTATYPP